MKGETMPCEPKQEMLFGHPKWDVENLADSIMRTKEMESTKPGLYEAAVKLLERRQKALGIVIRAAANKK